jgi:hypothetical protein
MSGKSGKRAMALRQRRRLHPRDLKALERQYGKI